MFLVLILGDGSDASEIGSIKSRAMGNTGKEVFVISGERCWAVSSWTVGERIA